MDKYAIVGYPLEHSFSPQFFTKKFLDENINAEYHKFEIEKIDLLPDIIDSEPDLRGFNVTIPYKEQVIPYLDELDQTAKDIGAVNVVKVIRKGDKIYLKGYNSDLIGFQNSIKPLLDMSVHREALILGTGGASKAVNFGLKHLGINTRFVSRSPRADMYSYDDLTKEVMNKYKVIVNASPVGTYPKEDECPAIPYEYLTENHLLYDLVYNPEVTKFLELGNKQGAKTKNGKEMLVLQAIAAWEIWNNRI